ncbi:hypothetical protein PHISP_01239 [Aspergillus sp. HF37]|nr:hypothetical protein PHISP_01239 [Aspergillus sp. HF37]
MPIKWTPENDQLLLLKILETNEINVDTKKIADAWPAGDATPTPRAIRERLVKIRKDIKATGAGDTHFSIGDGSAASTPVKPRAPKSSTGLATPASGKRKRTQTPASKKMQQNDADTDAEGENGSDMDVDTPSKKPASGAQMLVKQEPGEETTAIAGAATASDAGSVTPKRDRKTTAHFNMVDYPSDNDGEVETSASEFVPDESFETGVAVKSEEHQ